MFTCNRAQAEEVCTEMLGLQVDANSRAPHDDCAKHNEDCLHSNRAPLVPHFY